MPTTYRLILFPITLPSSICICLMFNVLLTISPTRWYTSRGKGPHALSVSFISISEVNWVNEIRDARFLYPQLWLEADCQEVALDMCIEVQSRDKLEFTGEDQVTSTVVLVSENAEEIICIRTWDYNKVTNCVRMCGTVNRQGCHLCRSIQHRIRWVTVCKKTWQWRESYHLCIRCHTVTGCCHQFMMLSEDQRREQSV